MMEELLINIYVYCCISTGPALRLPAKYGAADTISNAVMYILTILTSLKHHCIYSDKDFPNSRPLKELSLTLQHHSSHPAFVQFLQELVTKL